jgi:predicted transcriptional regulator
MIKRTFVLDDESASYLDRTARRLGVPKSQVVREALRVYGEQLGRLSDEERDRALAAFDRAIANVPARPRSEVKAELDEIARVRKGGGRRLHP